jgi:site-specific recombinase XerD
MYKTYRDHRPAKMASDDSPFFFFFFFVAINHTHCAKAEQGKNVLAKDSARFKNNPLGQNKLGSILTTMCKEAEISNNETITNHSARKTLVQKLVTKKVPPTAIVQITGHKNTNCVNTYCHITER